MNVLKVVDLEKRNKTQFTSIKAKLLGAFLISSLISLTLVFSFLWYANKEKSLNTINDLLVSSHRHFSDIKLHEKDFFDFATIDDSFFIKNTHTFLEKHRESLKLLQKDLEALKKVNELNIRKDITDLQQDFRLFADTFSVLKKVILERGFKDYGSEGKMRDYIHSIEELSKKYPLDLSKILMIRRHEKDFFLRKEDKYIDRLKKAIVDLQDDLRIKIQSKETRNQVYKLLEDYKNLFLQIVKLEQRIGFVQKSGLKHNLKEQANKITQQMDKIDREILIYIQNIRYRSKMIMWVLFVVFLLLNIGLGYFVIQKFGKPIQNLSQSIHEVIKQNFEKSISITKVKSKDEIGKLSKDFNLMLHKVHEKTDQVLAQKEQLAQAYRNLRVLSKIGQDITSHLNIEDILIAMYQKINELMNVNVLAIGMYDQDNNILDFLGKEGEVFSQGKDSIEVNNTLSVWCYQNQETVLINDIEKDLSKYIASAKLPKTQKKSQSLIYVPLTNKKKKIGVFTAQTYLKNHYTPYHLTIAKSLGIYLSIALDNVKVYKKLDKKNKRLEFHKAEIEAQKTEIEANKAVLEDTLKVVQKQTDKILSSIEYASVMQSTIFPTDYEMKEVFQDFFQVFRPKDVVSGDFCWLADLQDNEKFYAFFALADCTGHGVPGAFMSMMSHTILNQIIMEDKIVDPAEILMKLHKNVQRALRQTASDNQDGLDIGLVRIETINMNKISVVFAGAKHSLFVVKNNKLQKIKGNRFSIGGYIKENQRKRKYENHHLELSWNDTLYFTSDGLPDNANPERKKFGLRRFESFIAENSQKPLKEQEKILNHIINNFQQDTEQRDDILVMGLKL